MSWSGAADTPASSSHKQLFRKKCFAGPTRIGSPLTLESGRLGPQRGNRALPIFVVHGVQLCSRHSAADTSGHAVRGGRQGTHLRLAEIWAVFAKVTVHSKHSCEGTRGRAEKRHLEVGRGGAGRGGLCHVRVMCVSWRGVAWRVVSCACRVVLGRVRSGWPCRVHVRVRVVSLVVLLVVLCWE